MGQKADILLVYGGGDKYLSSLEWADYWLPNEVPLASFPGMSWAIQL